MKSVRFTLPPCYSNRYREVLAVGAPAHSKNWFECKEAGWGPVNIQMQLEFKDLGYPLAPVKLQHITSFKPTGESKIHKIKIPRDLAEQLHLA